ncbi:MAG: tyrosine-type recombinase/integrase [Candidatus Freyarchaeota archaeon]
MPELSALHRDTIRKFLNWKKLEAKKATCKRWKNSLSILSAHFPEKKLEDLTRHEIEEFLANAKETYSYNTFQLLKLHVKSFYRYLGQGDKVDHIRIQPMQSTVKREDLLTQEDLRILFQICSPMYRALLAIVYEGGLRIDEALRLKVGNVEPTDYGFRILVPMGEGEGSTKKHMRSVPITNHRETLAQYLQTRPDKKDAPLFPGRKNKHLSYNAAQSYLENRAKQLGRRVWWHLLRHQRCSEISPHLSEEVLRKMFGWRRGSKMPGLYSHLSPQQVEQSILAAQGVHIQTETLETVTCPRCNTPNPNYLDYCQKCSTPINPNITLKILKQEQEKQELLKRVEQLEKSLKKSSNSYPNSSKNHKNQKRI